jgi:hypothetical protein
LAYAILFNVIPVARSFWIKSQNAQIQGRNRVRTQWKSALGAASRGSGRLGTKLKAATKMGTRLRQLGAQEGDIIFDTSKPIEDIQQKKNQESLEEFDKLLENDDSFQ